MCLTVDVCERKGVREEGRKEGRERIESSERKRDRLNECVIVTTDGTFRIKLFHHAVSH